MKKFVLYSQDMWHYSIHISSSYLGFYPWLRFVEFLASARYQNLQNKRPLQSRVRSAIAQLDGFVCLYLNPFWSRQGAAGPLQPAGQAAIVGVVLPIFELLEQTQRKLLLYYYILSDIVTSVLYSTVQYVYSTVCVLYIVQYSCKVLGDYDDVV